MCRSVVAPRPENRKPDNADGRQSMTTTFYNLVKAALGWSIYCDGVRLGGIYASKEAALEATTVAASFAVRDGAGVQINIPSAREPAEIPLNWISAVK
jgi:hypothetical protein